MSETRSNAASRKKLGKAKTIVIKLGSSVLTAGGWTLNDSVFDRIAAEVSLLQDQGRNVILVSSGAVAAGREFLQWSGKSLSIPQKQAAAAVGQGHLIHRYQAAFARHEKRIAQLLLTHDDLSNRSRFLNARHTLTTLLDNRVIPVINENDSVIVDEIKFGDNDTLAALITHLSQADLLILLTDIDGLYDDDPRTNPQAQLIAEVKTVHDKITKAASSRSGKFGVGGMSTKVSAARRAASYGIPTLIANGNAPGCLQKILSGEIIGTLFLPENDRLSSREYWIAHTLRPRGQIQVDAGAKTALLGKGKSLLPKGISAVHGNFDTGDAIEIVDEKKKAFAQGLSAYSAKEIEKIRGRNSSEIEKLLGYKYTDEVVHRDDLVILEKRKK